MSIFEFLHGVAWDQLMLAFRLCLPQGAAVFAIHGSNVWQCGCMGSQQKEGRLLETLDIWLGYVDVYACMQAHVRVPWAPRTKFEWLNPIILRS